ncbi:MAG: MSHA biogenesis protein MshD [Cellvibrio sp.]|uniref:type IV pilus modification PilV family protein n=1 Tax=Cellvibrio sp. TaxID=1965322 RepID=UPI0031B1F8B5
MLLQINGRLKRTLFQRGVSLIEMIVFIVVVSVALVALVNVYRQATIRNADPIIRVRALEAAQSKLDEIIALQYDAMTPAGGIPACGLGSAPACNNLTDDDYNDVDDYHNRTDNPYPNYVRSVTVVTNSNIKVITVTVKAPTGDTIVLASERANF